jgi:hypothetical protein
MENFAAEQKAGARADDFQSGSALAAADGPLALALPLSESNSATRPPAPARPRGGILARDQGDISSWAEWGHF